LHITHLGVTNFRNFASVQVDFPPHIVVLRGDNGQGKSNLLEAVYVLATSRSHRATNERELINWSALDQDLPVCRLSADVERSAGTVRLELALSAQNAASAAAQVSINDNQSGARPQAVQKRIRVNGVPRRAFDLVGHLTVVAFGVQDINIVSGAPALRRRYLDVTNSQVDRRYLRALQRYQRVLWQRNRLLRLISLHQAKEDELAFWDAELVENGSYLMQGRQEMVAALNELAGTIHQDLSDERTPLTVTYVRSTEREKRPGSGDSGPSHEDLGRALEAARTKELALGMTLVGPHRDDLRFTVQDVDMSVYGSRGQQRVVALALKLAEARFMHDRTGEDPVLLLDDVLSELDAGHRSHLLASVAAYRQVLMTTTDLDHFDPGFLERAALYHVSGGRIEPARS
jgi:DNA replication and repair protein RecF